MSFVKKDQDNSRPIGTIFLALPLYGNGEREMWMSILEMLGSIGHEYSFDYGIITDRPVIEARRNLVEIFLKTESHYLLFVDADMVWASGSVKRLIEQDKDIITGLMTNKVQTQTRRTIYYRRADNVLAWIKDLPSETEPFEIDYCGAAFMLIKRKVLENLGTNCFERVKSDEGIEFGEDVSFCMRVKNHGFKIWCDPQVKVGHVGRYIFTDADVRSHL